MPQCDQVAHVISLEEVPRAITKKDENDTRKNKIVAKIGEHLRYSLVPGVATGTLDGSSLKEGERGCAMAHRELWDHLRRRSTPDTTHLILEDDASIIKTEDVCGDLARVSEHMRKSKLDMVNLGPCFWNRVPEDGSPCMHAYMLSDEGVRKVYDRTDSHSHPIDLQLMDLCKRRELRCHVEELFRQSDDISYINGSVDQWPKK